MVMDFALVIAAGVVTASVAVVLVLSVVAYLKSEFKPSLVFANYATVDVRESVCLIWRWCWLTARVAIAAVVISPVFPVCTYCCNDLMVQERIVLNNAWRMHVQNKLRRIEAHHQATFKAGSVDVSSANDKLNSE